MIIKQQMLCPSTTSLKHFWTKWKPETFYYLKDGYFHMHSLGVEIVCLFTYFSRCEFCIHVYKVFFFFFEAGKSLVTEFLWRSAPNIKDFNIIGGKGEGHAPRLCRLPLSFLVFALTSSYPWFLLLLFCYSIGRSGAEHVNNSTLFLDVGYRISITSKKLVSYRRKMQQLSFHLVVWFSVSFLHSFGPSCR